MSFLILGWLRQVMEILTAVPVCTGGMREAVYPCRINNRAFFPVVYGPDTRNIFKRPWKVRPCGRGVGACRGNPLRSSSFSNRVLQEQRKSMH